MNFLTYKGKIYGYDNNSRLTLVFENGKWENSKLNYMFILQQVGCRNISKKRVEAKTNTNPEEIFKSFNELFLENN